MAGGEAARLQFGGELARARSPVARPREFADDGLSFDPEVRDVRLQSAPRGNDQLAEAVARHEREVADILRVSKAFGRTTS
jgi:hypothetical protein